MWLHALLRPAGKVGDLFQDGAGWADGEYHQGGAGRRSASGQLGAGRADAVAAHLIYSPAQIRPTGLEGQL
jgi:hypothetical protein